MEFEPAVFALDVDGAPMPVRGRIDRLDRHAVTGAWRVIDYKTGEKGDGPAAVPRQLDLEHVVDVVDLSEWMVEHGHAVSSPR